MPARSNVQLHLDFKDKEAEVKRELKRGNYSLALLLYDQEEEAMTRILRRRQEYREAPRPFPTYLQQDIYRFWEFWRSEDHEVMLKEVLDDLEAKVKAGSEALREVHAEYARNRAKEYLLTTGDSSYLELFGAAD